MDIPISCNVWLNEIQDGDSSCLKLLGNLRKDKCIPGNVCDQFFNHLATKASFQDPKDAKNTAIDVVKNDPNAFLCHGGVIPGGSFGQPFRLEGVDSLLYRLPEGYLDDYGINDGSVLKSDAVSDDEINAVIATYTEELRLGNLLGMFWVTDYEEVEQVELKELIDRLGIDGFEEQRRCLKIVYRRDEMAVELHLPRSFDGINQDRFELVEDCNAIAGKTKPLNFPPEQGLPEAVHRKCEMIPVMFTVEPIE